MHARTRESLEELVRRREDTDAWIQTAKDSALMPLQLFVQVILEVVAGKAISFRDC